MGYEQVGGKGCDTFSDLLGLWCQLVQAFQLCVCGGHQCPASAQGHGTGLSGDVQPTKNPWLSVAEKGQLQGSAVSWGPD